MSVKLLLEKAYWHFFKVMPVEMILKKKWDEYRKVRNIVSKGTCDISGISCNKGAVKTNKTLWVYWDSGIENAPAVVKKCRETVINNVPDGWDLVELTNNNYSEYVRLPSFIDQLLLEKKLYLANWSDILRTSLLYYYGGIWLDSTCFITQKIPNFVLDKPLFMFSMSNILRFSPMIYESWFIRAEKNNYVLGLVLEKMLYYFTRIKNKKEIYYVWFYILSTIYDTDRKAKEMMDNIWFCDHHDAALMHVHYGFDHKYSEELWEQIVNKCFVQKLSYKYDDTLERVEDKNLIQHFLETVF